MKVLSWSFMLTKVSQARRFCSERADFSTRTRMFFWKDKTIFDQQDSRVVIMTTVSVITIVSSY